VFHSEHGVINTTRIAARRAHFGGLRNRLNHQGMGSTNDANALGAELNGALPRYPAIAVNLDVLEKPDPRVPVIVALKVKPDAKAQIRAALPFVRSHFAPPSIP
jgi:hypothetical protein